MRWMRFLIEGFRFEFGGGAKKKGPKLEAPEPPPAPEMPDPEKTAEEARRRMVEQMAANGRGATILTSGVGDTRSPVTRGKTLLGA